MSNHDYIIANDTGAVVRADINSALAAIVSNNSSATAPATTYAYQWWADTTAGFLKMRNASNSGWVNIIPFTETAATLAGSETLTNKVLLSPVMTGIPIAPTAQTGTNTTQLATTAFVAASAAVFTSAAASIAASVASANAAWSAALAANPDLNPWGRMNPSTLSADVTLAAGYNAISAGPITIGEGVTVTLNDTSNWTIV